MDKDIICAKIVGMLHDIGHGPFLHVYDGAEKGQGDKEMARARVWYQSSWRSAIGYRGWECEYDSLIMIDALLKYLGLEIDKDEESLDKPLRQIGDGIDARCFGTHVGLDEDSDLEGNASDMEENNF